MTDSARDQVRSADAGGWAKWLFGAASTGTAAAAFFFPQYAVILLMAAQGIAVRGVVHGDRIFAVATILVVSIALIQSPMAAVLVYVFPPIFLLFAALPFSRSSRCAFPARTRCFGIDIAPVSTRERYS